MDEWQVRLAEMETVVFKTVLCHIRKHHLGEITLAGFRGTRSCQEQSYSSFPLSPPELGNKVLGTSFSLFILDLIFCASQIPLRV